MSQLMGAITAVRDFQYPVAELLLYCFARSADIAGKVATFLDVETTNGGEPPTGITSSMLGYAPSLL
jgi:hypothetical protein